MYIDLNKTSVVDIHQLMNVVPLIQEKWSDIGTKLNVLPDQLNKFWQTANEHQIPAESKNTFCCIQMLKHWLEENDNPFVVDLFIKAIEEPYLGLENKISSITAILTSKPLMITSANGKERATNPPDNFEESYIDMKAMFCLELAKSQPINNILVYLKICNIKSEIFEKAADYPSLIQLLEDNGLQSRTDLSWLKYIAKCSSCMKATEIIEKYERLLFADKITWSNNHPKGSFLVGKISKSPEFVTIKDASNAKSVASKLVRLEVTDTNLDSSGEGSVLFYWKVIKDVTIYIPECIDTVIAKECEKACLTHIGIMNNGKLDLQCVDELIST